MTPVRCPSCGHTHAAPEDERAARTMAAQQAEIEELRRSRAALIDGPIAAAVQRDAENAARIAELEGEVDRLRALLVEKVTA